MDFRSLLEADLIATPGAATADGGPECVRFARWDGGPPEVVKAQLSGWYYIDDPRAAEATARWYDDANSLELLREANVNWIWVTVNVGFSDRMERRQQESLAPFVRRCRRERSASPRRGPSDRPDRACSRTGSRARSRWGRAGHRG